MPPLVSCILPTRNRATLISVAIHSFLSQTYAEKELIILDNGDDHTDAMVPHDPRITYTRVGGKITTGEMRNRCNRMANGEIIAHFDSDDWSAPQRLTTQVAQLGEQGILTGYYSLLFYDLRTNKGYRWGMDSTRFAVGTSLCYRKLWWEHHQFVSVDVGEDFQFFQRTNHLEGQHVHTFPGEQMMVALVHDDQTSLKNLQSERYQPVACNQLPEAFLAFQHHHEPR